MSMLDGAVVYEELGRALAPSPHFVSCGDERGRHRCAAGTDEQQRRVAAADRRRATRSSRRRGSSPSSGFGPDGRAARAPRPTATASRSTARSGTCRSRRRPTACSCSPAPATAPTTSTCSSSTRRRAGVTLTQQLTISSDTQYAGRRSTACGSGADAHRSAAGAGVGRRGTRRCTTASSCSRRRPSAAREYALEITVAVRQGPRAVRQAARRVPGARALPRRRGRPTVDGGRDPRATKRRGRASTGRPIDRLAPMAKLFACQTFRDVTAMAQQIFGGVGFTARVRHPALLPPRQAAPDLVVGRPLPRGARRPPTCSTPARVEPPALAALSPNPTSLRPGPNLRLPRVIATLSSAPLPLLQNDVDQMPKRTDRALQRFEHQR